MCLEQASKKFLTQHRITGEFRGLLRDRKAVEIKLIIALSSSQSGLVSFVKHCSVLWKEFECRAGERVVQQCVLCLLEKEKCHL